MCPLIIFSADELDAAIRTAVGGDAAGEIRRLEDALKRLRSSFQEAKDLAVGSEEAAAKCQASGWSRMRKGQIQGHVVVRARL